ncbi:hypothetical protein RRG08_051700 [Elysia crispata]|uniref:Sialin n=1 Tax=Elysia crispata TaxID=231223 RepID=A0AAE1BAU1_9GAST|nr:hypothetical protein RRG08_051700 [Elysia crispata]
MMSSTETSNVSTSYRETDPLVHCERTGTRNKLERPRGIGSRHVLTFWAFVGFINVYAMRVNLSVAMVAMVNSSSSTGNHNSLPHKPLETFRLEYSNHRQWSQFVRGKNHSKDWEVGGIEVHNNDTCPNPPGWKNSTSSKAGEFHWDEATQGNILGAFFYGYMVSQIPGGWLATRYGGKRVFGLGVLCTSVLTLLTPLAARTSLYLLIALRVVEGIGEGVTFPAMHSMYGLWAPVFERSKLVVFAYAGSDIGTVISLPISGVLCDSDIAGGWPSVFYLFGTLGVLWTICWMVFVHDSPASHPRISEVERTYIEGSIGKVTNHSRPPWGKIFTSSAVWAIVAAHVASNWGLYVFLTCLPTYMKEILKFDIETNASLSAIPYALSWVIKSLSGPMADFVRRNGYLSTKNTRKLFNSLGSFLPAGLVLLVGVVGCNHVTAVLTLTLCVGTSGFAGAGYSVNHLDISPRFCGILLAITNAFGTIPGFVSPLLVGFLTNNNQTRGQWQIVFYISAAIYVVGASIFVFLAQGEVLSWGGLNTLPVSTPDSLGVNYSTSEQKQERGVDDVH